MAEPKLEIEKRVDRLETAIKALLDMCGLTEEEADQIHLILGGPLVEKKEQEEDAS